jgi:hypothetical protein
MSSNKIGVDNKDILRIVMFNIRNIKAEGEGITLVKEAGVMEEDKGDIREEDMREISIQEGVDIEAMMHHLNPTNTIIHDLELHKIKTLIIIMTKINMKIKILIIKNKVNIQCMKSKTMDKNKTKRKEEQYLMMKNITKNKLTSKISKIISIRKNKTLNLIIMKKMNTTKSMKLAKEKIHNHIMMSWRIIKAMMIKIHNKVKIRFSIKIKKLYGPQKINRALIIIKK